MLHAINIFIHVFVAILAIIIGIIPYLTQKGGRQHRRSGRIFLLLMGIVILTALSGVFFFIDRPFLTIVTLLWFYTSYSGYRVLKTKEKGFAPLDFAVMIMVVLIGASFAFQMNAANVLWNNAVVYYLFGYFFLLLAFDMTRYFFPNLIRVKRFWLYEHIYKMTGSFSALIAAGAGTVLYNYEPYNQILPALFTTLWLIFCLFYFPRQLNSKVEIAE